MSPLEFFFKNQLAGCDITKLHISSKSQDCILELRTHIEKSVHIKKYI